MTPDSSSHINPFLADVIRQTPLGERLTACIQCGTCGGSCPNGSEMEASPRRVFALIHAGERDRVLGMDTMWKCVSCYLCTSRCPQKIPVTDVMYTLKRMSIEEGRCKDTEAPALARAFTGFVDRYGRSFELGVASRFYLTQNPAKALRQSPVGMSLFTHGRMTLRPKKIRGIGQLQTIIRAARAQHAQGEPS